MNIEIDINIEEATWNETSFNVKQSIEEAFSQSIIYSHYNIEEQSKFSISVCLSNNKNIRKLNKQFRDKDKDTNVLSFPDGDLTLDEQGDKSVFLGDIIFAYQVIAEEATYQKKLFKNHFFHLAVHSILHLLGYDHITENEAKIMENIEISILKKLNIENPYL